MKRIHLISFAAAFLAVSLACQALSGSGAGGPPPPSEPLSAGGSPTAQPGGPGASPESYSEYPLLSDAENVVDQAGALSYQTRHNLDEIMKFYRDTLASMGYTERTINTVTTDTTFNLVFDGDDSGKALVVQGVDLGGGLFNVTIYLQDI